MNYGENEMAMTEAVKVDLYLHYLDLQVDYISRLEK